MEESDEEKILRKRAGELESAISTILFCHGGPDNMKYDQSHLRSANEWITSFLSSPQSWPTSLYLSFPPSGSDLGKVREVRFFSLNLLLSKIRNDWINVPPQEARHIYEVLLRQIPLNHEENMVGGRLCIVAAAAAALAGADTCYELVTSVLGDSVLHLSLKVELLTALAEETLHRGHSLSWMVKECMQECCPQVLLFLNTVVVSCNQSEILGKMFTCFERWIAAGVVLSELYTEYGSLFMALLKSLKSPMEHVFQPAVWALSELVSQVDVLPGREQAVAAIIKTILEQKWQYDAAAVDSNKEVSVHARGLCLLLSEIASIEGALLCRSGVEGVKILEWLVDASRGGGGLGLEGALMAVAAWPRLVNIYYTRRGDILQPSVFAAAAEAILQAAQYSSSFEMWDDSPLEEELFGRFRTDIAEGALVAIYKELNGAFLSRLLETLRGSSTWPHAEVCLFCIASISKEVIASVKVQNNKETDSFLKAVYSWLLGSLHETGSLFRQNEMFLETSVILLKNYAEWIACNQSVVQLSIQYVLNSFSVSAVRYEAACALKELCNTSAASLIATWPIDTLIGNCEAALCVPSELLKEEEMLVQVAVVQGLAAVIGALPLQEAERGLARVTLASVSTIKEIANAKEGDRDKLAPVLELALNIVAGVVEYGFGEGRLVHPALLLLQEIWPSLESLTITWAANGVVATALCNLWGSVASKVGMCISEVLPGVITAASSMFKFHRVAAPLSCLSKVTALVALKPTSELEKCLASMLFDVTSMLEGLDKVMNDIEQKISISGKSDSQGMQEDLPDNDIGNSLSRMYELGQSFLVYFPHLILPSGAFRQLFSSAIGSLNRKDPDVALASAYFLFDSVVGPPIMGSTNRDERGWKIHPELRSHLDQVVSYYGKLVVEAVLRRLSVSGAVESLKEALSDVLHGFCVSYRAVAEAGIVSTLSAPDFPGKLGFKLDSDKKRFLDSAINIPPHSRIRFRDLMRAYSGVCQMLLSTETLEQF